MISGAGAMNPVCPREDGRLEWGNGVVSMLFDTAGDSPRLHQSASAETSRFALRE